MLKRNSPPGHVQPVTGRKVVIFTLPHARVHKWLPFRGSRCCYCHLRWPPSPGNASCQSILVAHEGNDAFEYMVHFAYCL